MPYSPESQFTPFQAAGIASQGFQMLGDGIAKALEKKKEAEAQAAGAEFGFNTLKQAGLISHEEETKFLSGNANAKNAIVMAATPRLLQKFQQQKEQNDQDYRMSMLDKQQKMIDAQTARQKESAVVSHQNMLFGQSDRMLRNHGWSVDDLGKLTLDTPFVSAEKTPNSVKYVDKNGNQLSTEDALKLQQKGEGAFGMAHGLPRIPLHALTGAIRYYQSAHSLSPPAQGQAAPPPVEAPAAPVAPAAPMDMKALAQKAIDDPNASEAHKAAAKKILGLQ